MVSKSKAETNAKSLLEAFICSELLNSIEKKTG